MKELVKKRWFVFLLGILIAVVILLVIGFILYCNGYRVTYPQQFETSWDAVSGFAAWFGVGVSIVSVGTSFAAVWAAIQVPKEIANQQEKVELYTKRLEFYNTLDACIRFSKDAEKQSTQQMINYMFAIKVGFGELPENRTYIEIIKRALPLFHRVVTSLRAGEFLFDFEVQEYVQKIIDTLPDLLNAKDSETIQDCFLKYQAAVNEAQKDLVPLVKDTLKLWSNK